MASICFYFQVHQPYRLKRYRVFDVGRDSNYFETTDPKIDNAAILKKVAQKCYIPMGQLLLELLEAHPAFKVSFALSGVALEQFELYAPEVLDVFKKLVATGRVELIAETYYHSLSFLYSKDEFLEQVDLHKQALLKYFSYTPTTFRNTELIFNNDIARLVADMDYSAVLAEGADHVLGWRSPNVVYTPKGVSDLKLLLKNYKLSDDIAFRFSSQSWKEWPLTVEKYVQWISAASATAQSINLFMDYETFGEHQWEDTGIFDFMRALPGEILKNPSLSFATPQEVARANTPVAELDMPHYVSWADIERDLSAWRSNPMQYDALTWLYAVEQKIKKTDDDSLLRDWRKLTTSDHFYYMCTKWFNDGDVHKYFSPYETPYEAYIAFMNVLQDLQFRLENRETNTQKVVGS